MVSQRQEVDDIPEKLANAPAEAESLLYSLEQALGDNSVTVYANKPEYICFKQKGAIWNLSDTPSKISRPVHILRKQHLIYWKLCQDVPIDYGILSYLIK